MPKPVDWKPVLLCVVEEALDPSLQDEAAQKSTQPSDKDALLGGGQYEAEIT